LGLIENSALLCLGVKYGSEPGRTKLQKMIYFADRYIGWNVGDYKLHFYGPYSRNIATTLRTIRKELIEENIPGIGSYRYNLTDGGKNFLEIFSKEWNADQIKITQELFKEFGEWTKDQLELAATLDYVYKNTPEINKEGLIEKVSKIKDNFSHQTIEEAYELWSGWKAEHKF